MGNGADLPNEKNTTPSSLQIIEPSGRGFKGFSANRYESIFDDFKEEDPQMHYDQFEDRSASFAAAPTAAQPLPYEDTIVFIHFNKQGIRLSLQANMKTFLAILIIIVVIFSRPGVTDLIGALVKSVLGQH